MTEIRSVTPREGADDPCHLTSSQIPPPDIHEAVEFLRPVLHLIEALSSAAYAIQPEGLVPVADALRRALAGIDYVLARDEGAAA